MSFRTDSDKFRPVLGADPRRFWGGPNPFPEASYASVPGAPSAFSRLGKLLQLCWCSWLHTPNRIELPTPPTNTKRISRGLLNERGLRFSRSEAQPAPTPETRAANAVLWSSRPQNEFFKARKLGAASALLMFLAPFPEAKSSSPSLRPTPNAFLEAS